MSRIGKAPISMPGAVTLTREGDLVTVKGPRGTLEQRLSTIITIREDAGSLFVERPNDERESRSQHGLVRTLVSNMVVGVSTGFTRVLEVQGTGYRPSMDGKTLVLNVGYSHPVRVEPPTGITFSVEGPRVTVAGNDKQVVGEIAAQVRRIRPPEVYKGKGIRYQGEVVVLKAGKSGKAGGKKK